MASRRQRKANRLNAKKSTGPRTPGGKARSRRNAITHGLTAREIILAHEDPAKFEALTEDLHLRFKPRDALEEELVGRVAGLLWRLKRVPVFEAALLDEQQRRAADRMRSDYHDAMIFALGKDESDCPFEYESIQSHEMQCLARAMEKFLKNDLTSKLSTYEVRLQRQQRAALDELSAMQASPLADAGIIDVQADEKQAGPEGRGSAPVR